ncbi:Fic family protein [Streptococcus suis]|nr:Fic family protein [Streptococcus suis]
MQPNYTLTEKMISRVAEISSLTTRLVLEKRDLHLRKENRIRSIQSSLAIENNSLTVEQVTAIIEGKRVLGKPKEIHEVQNAYEAYEFAFGLDPYDINDFLRAHAALTQGLVKQSGKFRTTDVGVYDGEGNVVHVGARPQFIKLLVEDLFAWARRSDLHALIKSCIVHYELEIIHPFEDGNGRMGRLWQSLLLYQWESIFEWIPIETVIYKYQQAYYDSLTISNTSVDATVFIEFMLDAIFETLEEYSLANSLTNSLTNSLILSEQIMSEKEQAVFEKVALFLRQHSTISSKDLQELMGFSPATARRYLARFEECGYLHSSGSTKKKYYSLS